MGLTIILFSFILFFFSLSPSIYASALKGGGRCADLRWEIWRLWSYQTLPAAPWSHPVSNAAHNGFLLLVQLIYGIPVNAVHGNLVFLVLYQVNDAPVTVTTTVAPTTIADVVTMHIVPDEAPSLAPLRIPLRIRFDTCAPKASWNPMRRAHGVDVRCLQNGE